MTLVEINVDRRPDSHLTRRRRRQRRGAGTWRAGGAAISAPALTPAPRPAPPAPRDPHRYCYTHQRSTIPETDLGVALDCE